MILNGHSVILSLQTVRPFALQIFLKTNNPADSIIFLAHYATY